MGRRLLSGIVAAFVLACSPSMTASGQATARSNVQIRQVLTRWEKAFRAGNVDSIMAVYAPGSQLTAFDIVPPLRKVGAAAYRKNYEQFFAMYQGPVNVELRDLRIITDGNVAFIHTLERMSGTLKGGATSTIWLRVTSGLQRVHGKWLIVHDHVSVPTDFETGKAAVDLRP